MRIPVGCVCGLLYGHIDCIAMELINFENVMATLEEYAQEVRNAYQDKLINNDRISSGKLLNSVEYQVSFNGVSYLVQLTLEKYWKYLEYGISGKEKNTTRPFPHTNWGAYKHILEWVKVKPVLPRPDKNGKLPTPERLAGSITASLIKNGIEPGGEMKDAIANVNLRYKEKLIVALQKDVQSLMKVVVAGFQGSVPVY